MTASLKTMMADLDPARRRKIENRAAELIAEEMTLRELRRARRGAAELRRSNECRLDRPPGSA